MESKPEKAFIVDLANNSLRQSAHVRFPSYDFQEKLSTRMFKFKYVPT